MSKTYPWLTINPDGSQEIDMRDATGAEKDRRLVIAQEIRAGRVVEASTARSSRDNVVKIRRAV